MNKKQSGFGIIAIIVIVLVVGVLGFVGWRIFTAQSSSNNTGNNQTNNTQPSTDTYLNIKELGVKIKLSDEIKDAVYSVVPTSDGSKGVGISAQSLVDKSSECSPSNFTLGLIEAMSTAPTSVSGQPASPDNKTLFKLGDTYYWYRPPQNQTCLTDNQADINMVANKLDAFKQAFSTIQLDN